MKPTKYSGFCLQILGNFFSEKKKEHQIEKNILLEQANIEIDYEEYYSMTIMNMLIGYIGTLILTIFLHILAPYDNTIFFIIVLPPFVTFCIGAIYQYLPTYYIKKRAANIDLFLPYAINYINSMAIANISPSEIFSTFAALDVYGEIQTEAKKIAKEINIMGIDTISALKHALKISPSKKFKAFIQGIIGSIQSGSDLHIYLSNIVEKYMEKDLIERKKDLDYLAVIAEVFVIAVIAFPIFLVIILSVMGSFGGSMDASMDLLFIFSFLALPLIYVVFYLLIKSTSIERIIKVQSKENYNIKQLYEENKIPIFILLISAGLLAFVYVIIFLLSYYGHVDLALHLFLDIIFLSILAIICPIGTFYYMETKKKKKIQEVLPEFLIEIGDSISSGMTIFDAINVAENGHYGELTPEVKKMNSQLSWGISIKDVFNDFAVRMKSAIIQRIVVTINKGLMMGGKTLKIFKAAAREVDQINQIENQRKANMSLYALVILLCFFVFLTIILILNKTLFTSFFELQNDQMLQLEGVLTYNVVDPMLLKCALYSFVFVQSIGAGILSGFMIDGKLSSGVRYSCALGLISFFVFKFLF